MLLQLDDVEVRYNKVVAVTGVSMGVEAAGAVAMIGANGAGKSTILRAISGLEPTMHGRISFADEAINGLPAHEIVTRRIAHVPEGRRIFKDMSVLENLMTGAFLDHKDTNAVRERLDFVFEHFPRLQERRSQPGKTLSGGEQQMLAMGRALMSNPKLLLLDEPSMGLSPILVQEIARVVRELIGQGLTVLLVEQNAELALQIAEYAYVLETGRVVMDAPSSQLHENEHVRQAYLGI
ncbi:MAG: ABC transporter ATP-binding protein [Halofilum sp. (in: g-proteobacteria)]|nr:ABC transporter ATP-binding protein [Halofilum sp. (in: g-proteobacteria)]